MEAQQKLKVLIPGVNSKNIVYNSFDLDKELTKVNPVKALTSGKITKDDIGKIIYLSNSAISCQEWIIIGINHNDVENTVDLISKAILRLVYTHLHITMVTGLEDFALNIEII